MSVDVTQCTFPAEQQKRVLMNIAAASIMTDEVLAIVH